MNALRRWGRGIATTSSIEKWGSIRKLQPPESELVELKPNQHDGLLHGIVGNAILREYYEKGDIKIRAIQQREVRASAAGGWLQIEYPFSTSKGLRSAY